MNKDASSRGGRAKTAAKMDATAKAQAARRQSAQARRAALVVPKGFTSAEDFLQAVAEVAGRKIGGIQELATACGVTRFTASKWMRLVIVPEQTNLDKIEQWWRRQLASFPEPTLQPTVAPGGRPNVKEVISLTRLPEEISERLRRTARRRNLTPIQYAAQLLDRALPKIEDLEQ